MSTLHSLTMFGGKRTRASLKESKGYPPPEKVLIEIPPLQEGYSLAKYSPPLEMFLAKYPKSPPPDQNFFRNFQKISEFWSRVV